MKTFKHYRLVGLILLLLATNPSFRDFKDYLGDSNIISPPNRTSNEFVFSMYDDYTGEYIGILGNFFLISSYSYSSNIKNKDSLSTKDKEDTISAIRLSIHEFAAKIKAKYPAYKNIGDSLLAEKIISKYPQYKKLLK